MRTGAIRPRRMLSRLASKAVGKCKRTADLMSERNRSNLARDAWFVALHEGKCVAMTELWLKQADPSPFEIGVTDVLRLHRRRGIAMALKLRGIAFGQKKGIRELRTWNASDNEGILEVNRRLRFVCRSAHIAYVKQVRPARQEDVALTLQGVKGVDSSGGTLRGSQDPV